MSTEVSSASVRQLPRHLGVIMDGNGRWARNRGLARIEGHRVGADSVRDIVRACRQLGIEALTLYAFSAQNWARPAHEVRSLMELLRDYLASERSEIMENGIRLRAIGDVERLPSLVREPLEALIGDSAENSDMSLVLALSYGSRESIARAAQRVTRDALAGQIDVATIDADMISRYLPTHGLPPLDLLVRTSGEQRISNFMLWELAYAELVFVDIMWPDFRRQELYDVLEEYAQRERRFGLTGAQSRAETDLAPAYPAAADAAPEKE